MAELAGFLAAEWQAMSAWEALAVGLAITYLVLAIRQNPWCWPAAIVSAAIFTVVLYRSGLFMQSVLQLFYIGMAVYGWRRWRSGGAESLSVVSWPARAHLGPLTLIVTLGLATGFLLDQRGGTAMPYLDALIAWGAVVTTWMVARKVLQNWHYWFVIDLASLVLYGGQGLWLTTGLFVVYLVMVVIGYRAWRATMANRDD